MKNKIKTIVTGACLGILSLGYLTGCNNISISQEKIENFTDNQEKKDYESLLKALLENQEYENLILKSQLDKEKSWSVYTNAWINITTNANEEYSNMKTLTYSDNGSLTSITYFYKHSEYDYIAVKKDLVDYRTTVSFVDNNTVVKVRLETNNNKVLTSELQSNSIMEAHTFAFLFAFNQKENISLVEIDSLGNYSIEFTNHNYNYDTIEDYDEYSCIKEIVHINSNGQLTKIEECGFDYEVYNETINLHEYKNLQEFYYNTLTSEEISFLNEKLAEALEIYNAS